MKLRGHAMADPGFYERSHPKSAMDVAQWATDADRGWHPNLLRIPCTQDSISHYGASNYVQNHVRPIVDLCADRGIYAMVDLHLVRPYTEQATDDSSTSYDKYPDEVVRDFWNAAAPEFAGDSHVLFELFNEPTEPAYWDDDQKAWSTWKGVAQPWVDRVRELAPETPVVIGSPRWTSVPDAAPDDPFSGNDLIYSGHIYPSNGQPSDFDGTYGAPASEVPIFITEFGWDPDGNPDVDQGTTSGWGEPFRNWVEGYENMGWAAWCFDDSWAPTFSVRPTRARTSHGRSRTATSRPADTSRRGSTRPSTAAAATEATVARPADSPTAPTRSPTSTAVRRWTSPAVTPATAGT
ncbi:glycoside hydrolase family 5 protein [Halosimplex aquaticum]